VALAGTARLVISCKPDLDIAKLSVKQLRRYGTHGKVTDRACPPRPARVTVTWKGPQRHCT
jgi:hypothetical protein